MDGARRYSEAILSKEHVKHVHVFKFPTEAHFHIDHPRGTSIGFVLDDNPIRLYVKENEEVKAFNCIGDDVFILNVKYQHAARRLIQQPWTFFISVTSDLSHNEIQQRFCEYAAGRGLEVLPFARLVQDDEDIQSLHHVNPEVVTP